VKRGLNAWLWALVCLSSISIWSPSSSLAQDKKRVVVLEFEGRGAGSVRGHVLDALKARSEVEVVSAREAEGARQRLGVSWGSAESYQSVAAELRVDAYVEGSVRKDGKRMRATVRVRDASTGLVSNEEPWTRKSLPQLKAVEENFWQVMGPAILGSSAPPEKAAPAAEPVEEEKEEPVARVEAEPEPEEPVRQAPTETSASHPALVAWVGPRLMWRTLSYEESTTLSSYENEGKSPAFNAAVGAAWFPGAHFRSDWLSNLGLEADFDYSIGLKSKQGNKKLGTTAYEMGVGALFRLPLDSFEPRFRVGYVKQTFDVKVPASTPLPGVNYSAVRIGLGTAIHLVDWLSLDVNAAYLYVLDTGEIGGKAFAQDLKAKAFEFGGAMTTQFTEAYGLRLGVDFRRYVLDFSEASSISYMLPDTGSDHYLRTTLAFVYRMAGASE
jgi:TolB-like protein